MLLKKIKESAEVRVLEINDSLIYFSKEDLVAYSGPNGDYRTTQQFSPSTNSHLVIIGAISWDKVPQSTLEEIVRKAMSDNVEKRSLEDDFLEVNIANSMPKIEKFSIKI